MAVFNTVAKYSLSFLVAAMRLPKYVLQYVYSSMYPITVFYTESFNSGIQLPGLGDQLYNFTVSVSRPNWKCSVGTLVMHIYSVTLSTQLACRATGIHVYGVRISRLLKIAFVGRQC